MAELEAILQDFVSKPLPKRNQARYLAQIASKCQKAEGKPYSMLDGLLAMKALEELHKLEAVK